MSAKPETTFYTSVHRHMPPLSVIHREKMSNPYRGGTFDHWYSAKRDLWVEWKFIKLPKRDTTVVDLCGGKNPHLSALQQDWGRKRWEEKRNVWVILGAEEGGWIMTNPTVWSSVWTVKQLRTDVVDRKTLAHHLTTFLQGLA